MIDRKDCQAFQKTFPVFFRAKQKKDAEKKVPCENVCERPVLKKQKCGTVAEDKTCFDERIAGRNRGFAVTAPSPKKDPAYDRDLMNGSQPVSAGRTEAVSGNQGQISSDSVVDRCAVRADDCRKKNNKDKKFPCKCG